MVNELEQLLALKAVAENNIDLANKDFKQAARSMKVKFLVINFTEYLPVKEMDGSYIALDDREFIDGERNEHYQNTIDLGAVKRRVEALKRAQRCST